MRALISAGLPAPSTMTVFSLVDHDALAGTEVVDGQVLDLDAEILGHDLAAGIPEDKITLVCALGSHGALTFHELRKKLGPELPQRFRVFNHNVYEHCVEVGVTSRGTRVAINRAVMAAELKVAISCVTAHPYTGFSGGGKVLMPGVAHIDTITHHHTKVMALDTSRIGLANGKATRCARIWTRPRAWWGWTFR